MSVAKLTAALKSGNLKTQTKKESEFRKMHSRIAAGHGVPKGVVPKPPRWTPSPENLDAARCGLEQLLGEWFKKHLPRGVAKVHSEKFMIRARISYGTADGEASYCWFFATAGNAQAGLTPFRMILTELELTSDPADSGADEGADGAELVVCREPLVATRRFLPWCDRHGYGMIKQLGYSDVAAKVLEPKDDVSVHTVQIVKVHCSLHKSDRFRTLGLDGSVGALTFSPGVVVADSAGSAPMESDDVDQAETPQLEATF